MMKRLSLGIGVGLAFVIGACGWVIQAHKPDSTTSLIQARADGSAVQAPTADEARIARITSQILAQSSFTKSLPRTEVSDRLWKEYLDSLDPRHLYFLDSDIQEFNKSRGSLDEQLIKNGDTKPAFLVFSRLLERVDQQNAYVNELLKNEKFDFSSNETFSLDRKTSPRPKDLDEAKKTWRDYLRYEYLQEKLNKTKPDEITKTLTRRYARLSKGLHEYDRDDIFQLYLDSLTHAYDPHSDYLGKSAYESFNIQMKLSLFGIGALLQSEDGYCKIAELTPGGPAEKSKLLKVGDKIVAVQQDGKEKVEVVDMKLDKIVDMIRGPKGTKVHLTLIPAGAADPSVRKTIILERDEIKLQDQEAKAKVIDYPTSDNQTVRLGVIELPSFYADFDAAGNSGKSTTADVARLLKKLQAEKVKGIILDLRGNPGGSLQEVINLTGLFVPQGPVVQVKTPDGKVQVDDSHNTSVVYDGPLVVMTSRFSASASEILAGALQDYGRALIVGDKSTFGKGTVQTVIPLDEIMQRNNINLGTPAGALKLTIQKFYRAAGSSTQLKGVVPDIILPSLGNVIDTGEGTLSNRMEWDTIPSASFTKLNRVEPVLAELRRRSESRVSSDKQFEFLKQDIDQYQKLIAQKVVSLNEQKRLQEKQDAEERAKKRRAELAAHPAQKGKVYLITLKDVDKPGLTLAPPPKPAPKPEADVTAGDTTGTVASNDDTTGANDIHLGETENILLDFIRLTGSSQARK